MFSEIFQRYDELICKFDLHSVQECIDAFLAINRSRHEKKKELSAKNEFEAYKRAQQLVKEFLVSDDESNFFAKIEEIRRKTLADYAERFENKCRQWDEILNNKEEQFVLLLKERLSNKPIDFGSYGNKKIRMVCYRCGSLSIYG